MERREPYLDRISSSKLWGSSTFYFYEQHELSQTLKIHIIVDHYKHYFKNSGTNFRHSNGEVTESAHSTLMQYKETHHFKIVKEIGTPSHIKTSQRSLTFFNSKKAGLTPPLRMRGKTSSPSSASSPFRTPSSSPLFLSSPSPLLHSPMNPWKQLQFHNKVLSITDWAS